MEETRDVSIKGVALKFGVINALIGIINLVIVDMAGLVGNTWIGYLPLLISAGIMFLAHKEFIKHGDGFMSYGQGLGLGTLMFLISSTISGVFTFIYTSYINPNYSENLLEIQRMGMEEQGMSDAQIEQAMGFTEGMMSPMGMAIMGVVMGVFFGFIIALIVSAITKKVRPEFE